MARPRLDAPNFRLIQRGGRFYVRWWAEGKAHRLSTGTADRAAATRFLAQFSAGAGSPDPPAQPVISQILDGYLADRKGHVAAYATLAACAAALRRHLGELQPDHLTKERSRFYRRRRRTEGHLVGSPENRITKPVRDGTIIRELVTLRAALRWAVRERWIAAAPYVELPPAPPARDRWLTREEADRLLAGAGAIHVRVFIALALYTGARAGAILELTWDRVDLDGRRIDLGRGRGNKDRAIVPIGSRLLPELAEARRAATCPYVVEHSGAGVASVKTGFRAAVRRAGLAGVTPHVLRHTAATWLVHGGVPLAEVAAYLGNSVEMIERVYGHHAPDWLRDAAAVLSGRAAK